MVNNLVNQKNIIPLLSICIPTYNRYKLLRYNLNEVLIQSKSFSHNIEILVGNNGSLDNTDQILKSFKNINVHNIDLNEGINPMIYLLTKRAKGKYIWILGDDDIPNEGLIEIIINNIIKSKKEKISFFLEGSIYTSEEELTQKICSENIINIKKVNDTTRNIIEKSGFISSNIILREKYLYYFQRSLSFESGNAYATKYGTLACHVKSNEIYILKNALKIGRITNKESHFISNPNSIIKTFLLDEFNICIQLYSDKIITFKQLIININNILSLTRLIPIIKSILYKLFIFLVVLTNYLIIFFINCFRILFILIGKLFMKKN